MTVLIISSSLDPASINIKNALLKKTKWEEIGILYKNPVYQHPEMREIIIITINDRKITHDNLDVEVEKKMLPPGLYALEFDKKSGLFKSFVRVIRFEK